MHTPTKDSGNSKENIQIPASNIMKSQMSYTWIAFIYTKRSVVFVSTSKFYTDKRIIT